MGKIGITMEMKWKIPDINGISYTSTMSIYSDGELIAELLPGKGLVLAKDPDTKESWIVAENPPPGDYVIVIESGNDIIVYDSGTIAGDPVIPQEPLTHSWQKILGDLPLVDVKTATDRFLICKSCPKNEDNVCLACGCFLPAKTKNKDDSCPLHKW
jgi:hypothetical protein